MKKYSVLLATLLAFAAVTACEKKPAAAPVAPVADAAKPADAAAPAAAPAAEVKKEEPKKK